MTDEEMLVVVVIQGMKGKDGGGATVKPRQKLLRYLANQGRSLGVSGVSLFPPSLFDSFLSVSFSSLSVFASFSTFFIFSHSSHPPFPHPTVAGEIQ